MRKIFTIFILFICVSTSLSQQRYLDFGVVFPAVNKTIVETSPSAGLIALTSGPPTKLRITFSLPANMNSGTNIIPLTFTATKSTNSNDNIPGTPFSPYTGVDHTFTTGANTVYLRLGGTITPSGTQAAGSYSGTIICYIMYI